MTAGGWIRIMVRDGMMGMNSNLNNEQVIALLEATKLSVLNRMLQPPAPPPADAPEGTITATASRAPVFSPRVVGSGA